jgi:hypothetical protein
MVERWGLKIHQEEIDGAETQRRLTADRTDPLFRSRRTRNRSPGEAEGRTAGLAAIAGEGSSTGYVELLCDAV